MAIELRTFASGDTDYIAKLNSNASTIQAAINALQQQAGAAGPGTAISAGLFMEALFNSADCLIGPGSYVVTLGATTLTVGVGSMYLAEAQTVVSSYSTVTVNFVGQSAGTHYITVGSGGIPTRSNTLLGGTIYSVEWTGSGFSGTPFRIAACFYDASEAEASRKSLALGDIAYTTLDARLEAGEDLAVAGGGDTGSGGGGGSGGSLEVKKVGLSLDGAGTLLTVGIKGMVQVDYNGFILGWSIVADRVGSITVEIDKKASSSPPAAPAIPDTTTDKISADAPIVISEAQSAAGGGIQVASWDGEVHQWDVIQFNVTEVTNMTRVTLYLRIQET